MFSLMVCMGSVAGAAGWAANMQTNALYYQSGPFYGSGRPYYALTASSDRYQAAFSVIYGFEFVCLIISKLMLLGRLAANATHSSQGDVSGMSSVRRRWMNGRALPIVYRFMVAAVVAGSAVCMVASDVTAAYTMQQAQLQDQAAAACDAQGNDTNSSLALAFAATTAGDTTDTAQAVQASVEALTLLLVTVAFVVIVCWSVAIFRLAERASAHALLSAHDANNMRASEANAAIIVAGTMQAAADNRRRLTAACVIVLVTFPARAAFDLLFAYAGFNSPINPACATCDPCQSTGYLISTWLDYTPEFQPIVVAVSSPLPLTLSLWLLTKAHARARLIAANVQRTRVGGGV